MAIEFKRGEQGDADVEDDRRRREAEATREEFGLATLSDDEELIDDDTFSRMHDRLAMGRSAEPESGSAAEAEPDELLLEEIATELPTAAAGAPVAEDAGPPADASVVAYLERQLMDAKDRDQVVEITLRIARYHTEAAALFVVNQGVVAGLRGSGGGLEDRLDGIMIPTGTDSLLAAPLETAKMARSGAPLGGVDQRVLKAMGRDHVHHVAVLPIQIGERVVNLLYVDNGAAPLAETSLGALRVLTVGVGRVYERMILARKRGGAPRDPSA